MRILTCERCGAEYEVNEHRTALIGRVSFECDCGHTLMRGKEVASYVFKMIKLGEEPENASQRR